MLLSQSKDQATVARGYILALLESNEVTAALIDGLTAEVITLNNSVDIVVTAASYRGVRGFSSPLILCDETSLWRDSESSVNPAKEIMRALAPGMASVSEPLMLSISTPWSKEGQHYETHTRNWGNNQSRVLAWQASSLTMNPTLDPRMIEDAYADDPEAARAEFGGEFRSDIATYVDRDVLMEAVEPERTVRGRMDGTRYYGFVDPSSGSKDSFVLAIAHREGDLAVLDVLQEHRPPFDPLVVIGECSKTLRSYGILGATGDRYAQGFVVSAFRSNGIAYNYSTRDRSQIYLDALPLLNARKARLLDNTRLVNQLAGLQRRSSASGRSTVDHARGGHDDAANGACGALVLAADLQTGRAFGDVGQVSITPRADPILDIGTGARNPATISATLTPVPSYDRFSPPQDW